jgi:hypothetical protein
MSQMDGGNPQCEAFSNFLFLKLSVCEWGRMRLADYAVKVWE